MPVTTELPPETYQAFLDLCIRRGANRSVLAREAIEHLLKSDERRGSERRSTERRKAS